MAIRKYGEGKIIPEEDHLDPKQAAWTEKDQQELAEEMADLIEEDDDESDLE